MATLLSFLRSTNSGPSRSEEHTSELQSPCNIVCRLLLEKKKRSGPCSEPTKCNICNSVLNFAPLGASNAADSHCLLYCVLRRGRVGAGGVPVEAGDDGGALSSRRRRRHCRKAAGGGDEPCAEAAGRVCLPQRRRRRNLHSFPTRRSSD